MSQFFSDKIKVISFISIILVLYIHSDFHDYPHEILGMTLNHYLQDFISKMIGRCAVPMFYSISGFLFFLHVEKGLLSILEKMRKRFWTLFVPFIIAALFYPAFFLILSLIPDSTTFINQGVGYVFQDKSFFEILWILFVDNGMGQPCAFHLWFLRDLILIIAITPLLYGIKMVTPLGVLSPVLCICTCFFPQIGLLKSIFWFVFGSEYFVHIGKCKSIVIPILFICLCITELLFPHEYWKYFTSPIILLGILSIWNLFDRLAKENFSLKQHRLLSLSCQFTFFIYLYHEPFINVIRKLLAFILGRNSFAFASSYLTSPWFVIVIGILVGYAFKKSSPKIYSILTGGR